MHNGIVSIHVYVCVRVTRVYDPLLCIHKKTSSYPLTLVAYKHGSITNEVALSSLRHWPALTYRFLQSVVSELWLRTDSKQQKSGRKKLASHFSRVSLWYLDVAMSSLMSPIHIPLGSPNHKLTTTTTTTTATGSTRSWMRPKCRTREIWKDPTEKKRQKWHSMGASLEKTRVKSMSQSTGFHCWVTPEGWLRWWIHEGFHFSRFTNFPTLWEGIGWDMVRCWGLRSLFLVHRFASQSRIKIPPKPTCARSTLTPHKCYNWIPVILPSPMKRVNFTRHLKYTLNLKMQGKYQRNKKYFIT